MAPRTRRALVSTTIFLATCAVAGSFISRNVAAQSASDESTLRDSLRSFTNVYAIVENNYADKLNGDKTDKAIYDGAIPGMLHVLDPHSNFYDPKAFAQMREDQHGRYYGVGMTIQPQMVAGVAHVFVLFPAEGMPAFKAGIKPGDMILTVDGKPTEGLDSAAVASMLKGPKGTHVAVVMQREGAAKPLTFDLVRGEIAQYSVDLAYEIKPGVGYIHVKQFMETTSREVSDAVDKFGETSMKGLVIDLRNNPGGLLNEAVNMSDKFLQKGQIVVSQKGRAFPDQIYRASHGSDAKYPIVVLVNRGTASAAEIVSGALQDHDRALIVGETTFGKGLVQTVFQVSENTGLALTTYHYYTPSGRLIQRNYSNISLYDYYYVREGVQVGADREVKLTDSGRTVYGGGGITPDEKIEPTKSNHFEDTLFQHYAFFNFSKHYLATHTVSKDFQPDDAVLTQFKAFLKDKDVEYTDQDIAANAPWIKTQIKRELFRSAFNETEGLRTLIDSDPQVAKAITFIPEAQALEDHVKSNIKTASIAKQ